MAPTAEKLRDAILANAEGLVASYLDAGADPNQLTKWPTLGEVMIGDTVSNDVFIAKRHSFPDYLTGITSVHVAVVNIYHNHKDSDKPQRLSSIKILKKLLEHGAEADVTMNSNCCLCNIRGFNWKQLPRMFTPIDLAVFLKLYKSPYDIQGRACIALDLAIQLIGEALADATVKVPHVSVAKSVVDMLKTMVLSDEFSDVRFECKDGTSLPAHKCVLSSASTYFHNYFTGPWGELAEHEGGVWKTSHSSDVVRAILMFVYTGEIPSSLLKTQAPTLHAASSEYDLQELVKLASPSSATTRRF
jgi:hypothetical protein